ncbi:PolC-type DNA polymerase III [Fructilactobacillus lindneri]|uniref:DNA polymerase III PolC-type n=2 Tax=Fructilactobacillus lindneri TaxID=53444 RepID=A0A0R2JP90_9LACO|nr:PolC-type DNA polymerase III [Fructilactobacillus lindneri]ANZ58103.1 PolC-type DNA polymerase III [Fructilactobacillus lindneri]ANZ59424.1 PolC-type DNA polymerase III [Fructilactobacillus lindneri]KRN78920.1 DNA polymerase III polC-type [Fructilactobacillus lindneri DSM 20690 = JCM 11027]POG98792.1 PolC-type DNA polymerase III [Fructilactobacillus lindneri]POH04180.1 PolC-type DNA polymerase III [Fructilactobacillus lindneri]
MSLNKKEQFDKLLDQIQIDKDQRNAYQDAQIDEVKVHQKSNKWEFHFSFPKVLPYNIFVDFISKLQAAFSQIANIDFFIKSQQTELNNRELGDYWEWIVKNSGLQSNLAYELCNNNVPKLEDGRVIFLAINDLVKDFMTNKALGPIEETYQKVGFPQFSIHTMVDETESQAQIQHLKAEKKERDEKLAKQARESMNKANLQKSAAKGAGNTMIGRKIADNADVTQMENITEEERSAIVNGYIFDKEIRALRSGRQLLILKVTDYTSSLTIKKFSKNDEEASQFADLQDGSWVKVRGSIQEDNYSHELVMNAYDINPISHEERQDTAPEDQKRVELHLHSNMSQMDATNSISDFVSRASDWGQKAIAITDHDDVQAFPDAYNAAEKNNIKMLYGMEANVVDDGEPIAFNDKHVPLKDATYVVFDTETTGLSAIYDRVIELSAVKMQGNNVIEEFEEFIDPGFHLSEQTTNLTSITDDMVAGSKSEEEVFKLFREFCSDSIVVGHNVTFDVGFMNTGYERHGMSKISNPIIDTLTLARFLYPNYKSYRLNTLAKKFDVVLEHHHRAIYDAETTGHLNYLFLKDAEKEYNIQFHDQLNEHMTENDAYKHARPFHAILMAQTQAGLKNLFKLVSLAHIKYFYRVPRIPRSEIEKYRDGILVGSACSSGEVFTAMMQKGKQEALDKAKFYDYLEVQPQAAYQPLLDSGLISDRGKLQDIIKNMSEVADETKIPLVATGDAHYLDPHDYIYRKILINSQGGANPLNRTELPKLHFRTTNEMLDDFKFLGDEKAEQIVVDNPNQIADKIEDIHPLKDKLYTPKMEGAEDEIKQRTLDTAHRLYGDELPKIVQDRLDRELKSIIGNGFSVIYLISQRLVSKSNKDGYLVGSRGSVGSSLVATMTGITEVNPLPPHYRCPNCQHSEFFTKGEYSSGFDLPQKKCSKCGTIMVGDGHNIPFETFLGFKGNKVPDIDLNFSGDYQSIAHNYTKVLFGENNVFRAGTIGTVADKTAYGYVKAYERDTGKNLRNAEIDRLSKGATGVKRTTGQHPAGIIVVPDYMDIYDFTPIQYPAEDQSAAWKTTHFDFHSIHDNILKLDILGHDDPTMIRMLQDLSGIDPYTIPMNDEGVMTIFSSPEILGVTSDQIFSKTGTLGIPEFGTNFVRGMLEDTHPQNFSDLLQISGLSHGTDVWLGNADELIKDGTATISNVIGCRDNIMTDLINYGVDSETSFQIMEKVRKGKGIKDEWQQTMRDANVPEWYIDSCLKIKYMFPRAHATAYVLMALRIAYFKVYFPLVYYAAYFSVRADDFDVEAMSHGKDAVKNVINEITSKGTEASTKEKNLLTVMQIANEMLERGFEFEMIDLQRSDASEWLMDGKKLIAPFSSVPGLGLNVAKQIVAAREDKPFISKEDLAKRGSVSKTVIEYMTKNGVLTGLPDENQLSLFDM